MYDFYSHPLAVRENFRGGKRGTIQKFNTIKNMYFYKILNLAINRFKYEGLPGEIDPYFLERGLFFNGSMLMLKDPVVSMYAIMYYSLGGNLDIYQFPQDRYAYATQSYFKMYDKSNSVIIRDSPTMYPFVQEAWLYAGTLANLWLTKDINVYWLRTPKLVTYPQSQGITVENILKDFNDYVPMIRVSDEVNADMFKSIDVSSPDVTESLAKMERETKANVLVDLGYSASAVEKKERVQSGELTQNQGEIYGMRNVYLNARQRAMDFANQLWGLDIKVTFNTDFDTMADEFIFKDSLGGGSND